MSGPRLHEWVLLVWPKVLAGTLNGGLWWCSGCGSTSTVDPHTDTSAVRNPRDAYDADETHCHHGSEEPHDG